MTLSIAKIERQIPYRPEGYYADVVSRGTIADGKLILDAKTYAELLAKYRSVSPWPLTPFGLVARSLKLLRTEADTGVGDTLARVIGPVGGTAYKQWFRATFGRACGCVERQANLNQLFPYDKTP